LDIEIKVRIVIGGNEKIRIILVDGFDGFICGLYGLYRPVFKDVKLATNGRYLRGGRYFVVGC